MAKTARGLAFLAVMAWRDPPASAQTAATNPDQADTSDPKLGQEATGIWPKREGDALFRPRSDGSFDYMGEIVAGLKELKNIFLQSLFVQGRVTNADPDSVGLWVEKVRDIRPMGVQVYTLDREPADKRIEKVSLATLQWIANQARWRAGVQADVF